MMKILAHLLDLGRIALRSYRTYHDDSLRANQGDRAPTFSFWRALVS